MVHLGDITADGAHDPGEFAAARSVFAGLAQEMRFVPGNHDIGDKPPTAPQRASARSRARLADYRRLFGPDRWSLDAGPWQLVGLDAQLFGTGTAEEDEQFTWLEEALRGPAASSRRDAPQAALPQWPGRHRGPRPLRPRGAGRRLLDCLAARDLRFVVSGHVHQTRRFQVGGVEHVWAPSTAYCIPDARQERIGQKIVGLMTLELTDAGHRFELVTPEGLVQRSLADHPEVYPTTA